MGNDGGSIPDRRDLVKTKAKAEQADKNSQTRAIWFFCALSKKLLQKPIVADELGKMYNKDAIVEYLLDKSIYGDGEKICGHIRSLKDVKTLTLTANPSQTLPPGSDLPFPPFVCPLTMKEMLGSIPFVFLWSCGCVFSRSGLKAIATPVEEAEKRNSEETQGESGSDKENKGASAGKEKALACPQCGKAYTESQIIPINPPPEEAQERLLALLARRASEPPKTKKRKAAAAALAAADEPEVKKAKPALGPSMASSAVAALLKEEEKKRQNAGMSAAVKSLYRDKDAKEDKGTFLTMGTFTRYA